MQGEAERRTRARRAGSIGRHSDLILNGSEEPLTGSEPGDNLVQISIKHCQEDGFSARAGIRACESLLL